MPTFRTGRADLLQLLRGFLMGGADIVPGVSGGTIALIVGIYERLVGAISRFDTQALRLLRRAELRALAVHVDLRFLAFLGAGILIGIVGLASTMHHLLEHQMERTLAAFFGMIVASSLIVARQIGRYDAGTAIAVGAGFAFAWLLVGLPFLADPPDHPAYLFGCGAVAICAMILPGISGAFILLILGQYFHVTGVLKGLPHGDLDSAGLSTIVAFAAGAVIGLLSFSKLLRFLLARFHATTMAVLAGFMLGSLRRIWPFKVDITPEIVDLKLKRFTNTVPDWNAASTWLAVTIAVAAGALVMLLEFCSVRLGRTRGEEVRHG